MLTIACNIPNGIKLRVDKKFAVNEALPDGRVAQAEAWHAIGFITLKGKGAAFDGHIAPTTEMLRDIAGADITDPNQYVLTRDIDPELWDTWLEQNKESDLITTGAIFVVSDKEEVEE